MELTTKNTNKIAVIGAGYWGKNLVRNFYGLDALGLVVDPSPGIQERMALDYPGVKMSNSYAEALKDTNIRGIAIATPAETHGNLIREAIYAGKDVCGKTSVPLRKRRTRIDSTGRRQKTASYGRASPVVSSRAFEA